jgi:hypothetical protein
MLPNNQVMIEDQLTWAVNTVAISKLVAALFRGELSLEVAGRQAKAKDGDLIVTESKYVSLDSCPAHLVAKAKQRLEIITPLLGLTQVTQAQVDARALEVTLAGHRVSSRSIYRWLSYYTQSHDDLRALIPNYQNSGGKGKTRLDERSDLTNRPSTTCTWSARKSALTTFSTSLQFVSVTRTGSDQTVKNSACRPGQPSHGA